MDTWLVATDFSRCAAAAVHQAARDLLARHGGRLVILHVIETGYLPSQFDDDHYRGLIEQHARRRLRATVDIIREQYPELEVTGEVREGSSAETIVETATAASATRIVVGTHSRDAREFDEIGSVAERVARAAVVPVLVVKVANDTTGLFEATTRA